METKPLLFGLIGFFVGGLIVSVAATTFDRPTHSNDTTSMSEMTESLKNLEGEAFDKAYITYMIEHHQAAVDMAELAEGRAKHQEIKTLSADIVTAQQAEIKSMQQWQTAWGYRSSGSAHGAH